MRRRILLLCFIFSACVAGWAQSFHYKKLESVDYEWAGQPLRFLVERQVEMGGTEREAAPARLQVFRDGKPIAMFELQWGVTQFRGGYAKQARFPENLVQSRYLLFVQVTSSKPPVLFAFGTGVGNAPGPAYAYAIDENGKPHQILAKEEVGFARFVAFGKAGELKLLTRRCTPQGSGDRPAPYDPYLVWKIGDSDVHMDSNLSLRYNQEFYLWSGAECRGDVVVVKGKDGKLRLRNTTESAREPGEEVHDVNNEPH